LEKLDEIENQTMHLHTQIIGKELGPFLEWQLVWYADHVFFSVLWVEHHQDNQQLGADLATAKEQQQQERQQEPASQWPNADTASVVSSQATGDFNVDK
jgi:hypothetical protein